MELLARLSWLDLVIIGVLAAGVFAGFTQGIVRSVLNVIGVIVAFVLAAQLRGPMFDLLRFWNFQTPEGRELLIFVVLFLGFVLAAFFAVRALYRRTHLPIVKQLDEIGGAIFGLAFVAVFLVLHLVVLDSFFRTGGEAGGWLGGYHAGMSESILIGALREVVVPTAGFLARPFVPEEIAVLLVP